LQIRQHSNHPQYNQRLEQAGWDVLHGLDWLAGPGCLAGLAGLGWLAGPAGMGWLGWAGLG